MINLKIVNHVGNVTNDEVKFILKKWNNMKPHNRGNWNKAKNKVVR